MATIVKQINDAVEARITIALPDYALLNYKIDVAKNNFVTNNKRFGVVPLDADPAPTILKHYSLDHNYLITLTHGYINQQTNDADQREKTFVLYDATDKIYIDILNTKAGIPNIILNIRSISLAEPEYLEDEKVVILRSLVQVRYRQILNS